jgi:hypothetical protein
MRTFRLLAFVLPLFSFLILGCTSNRSDGESSSDLGNAEIVVPQVESTYENLLACNEHAQPKDFVASGSGMNATISFYTLLSGASTGSLSRSFALVALRATELAPYYDADSFPPEELMTNFQVAINALDLLCSKVIESVGLSSGSTVIPTNESLPSDDAGIPANVGGIYDNEACNYIAQKIYFDPWGWDIYDIKADAEIDFGKTIGGTSYGIDGYLRNSFNKYIKILNSASSMTSDGMISGVFQTIANALQEYVDTHDPIPYPDFERDFDQRIIKLVSLSKQKCNATMKPIISETAQPSTTVKAPTTTSRATTAPTTTAAPTTTRATTAPTTTAAPTTTRATTAPTTTTTTTTILAASATIMSESFSAATLRGDNPSILYSVTLRCGTGCTVLPTSIAGRICVTGRSFEDITCTGSIMGGTGTSSQKTYTGAFGFGGSPDSLLRSSYLAVTINSQVVFINGSRTIAWTQ